MYKVLIVDDEPNMRDYLSSQVPRVCDRFQVVGTAGDGDEALNLLKEAEIDLIVTDIRMPVMNGLELCKAVQRLYPSVCMVILTGYEEFHYAQEALRYNVKEYLLKPIIIEDMADMLERIQSQLDERLAASLAQKGLEMLSSASQHEVIRKFLRALLDGSYIEVSTLTPLIYRMRAQLFEGEGLAMVVTLDERSLLSRKVSWNDYAIFRYILFQICSEITENEPLAWTFSDQYDQTVVVFSSTDASIVAAKIEEFYKQASLVIRDHTGLSLSAGIGERMEDILQLEQSYRRANRLLSNRFLESESKIYREGEPTAVHDDLEALSITFIETILESNQEGLRQTALLVAERLHNRLESARSYAVNLMHKMKDRMDELSSELLNRSIRMVESFDSASSETDDQQLQAAKFLVAYGQLFMDLPQAHPPEQLNEAMFIEKVKAYVLQHYQEPLSLTLLADRFEVSQSYLSQLFHKNAGETYIKFITRIRMEQSSSLLIQRPDLKVYEIAEMVGYPNVKHFSYVFKKHFGLTPGDYQSQHSG